MVILKHEPDFLVTECGQTSFIQKERIGSAQGHGAASGRLQRADNMEQSALPAPGRADNGGGFSGLKASG